MKNSTEKRTGDRRKVNAEVRFEIGSFESGGPVNVVAQGTGVDLSPGGMGMTTSFPLRGGEVVKLLFPVADTGTSLPVFSEVVWSDASESGCRAGLRFLS